MSGLQAIASMLTSPPVRLPQAASRSSSAGMAVVSFDFSAQASWPSTSRSLVANAETRCRALLPALRSWLRREVLPSRAMRSGTSGHQSRTPRGFSILTTLSHPASRACPTCGSECARCLTRRCAVGALGILLRQRWNGRHVAVVGFAAQPAEEDPFEQSRVEAICLGPAMLAGDGHAGGVDDVGFDAPGPEPARQPEAVAACLVRDGDAGDRAAFLGGLGTPAHEQTEQFHFAWFELLQRMALKAWDNAGDKPACLAHLNNSNDRDHALLARARYITTGPGIKDRDAGRYEM